MFGMKLDPGPRPNLFFEHSQMLSLGSLVFEVRFAPGHTLGHVMFYCQEEGVLFSGDVIFQGGIGRTDLPGGDYQTLLQSIRTQVLSLPDATKVYSGHGPSTTVGREREQNPFIT
jgi:glyoxylase-like metal-dependent hydrolase (beta-lactamase superfamily II)